MAIRLPSVLAAVAVAAALRSVDGFVAMSRPTRHAAHTSALSAAAGESPYALLFDCDGVIIETEELHRLAYNAAFKEFNLQIGGEPVEWSVPYYDVLQNTGMCSHLVHKQKAAWIL